MKEIDQVIQLLESFKQRKGYVQSADITYGQRSMNAGDEGYVEGVAGKVPDGTFILSVVGRTRS